MQFSDAVYGVQEDKRYVSYSRVRAMLDTEFAMVLERVGESRSKASRFFAYAATVAAKSFNRDNECHAWCGVQLQMYPQSEPSTIVLHVRLRDEDVDRQQQSMGVLGVNLIYAAFYYQENERRMIDSLTDNIEHGRIEIDSIEFVGPYFEDIEP
eukprot:UN21632